jgi:dTMP kinase
VSLFITLEGPDGGGKSTQAKELAAHLRQTGLDVLLTREPGGTPIGDQIRKILMSLDNAGMLPRAEFLLFSASRAQLVHQVIRPHLEKGGVVVCDRFFDSSLAYQGYGHQLDRQTLQTITAFATGGLKPDLTLLLDLPVESGLGRRRDAGHWNRLDDYDLEFHRRLRRGYQLMASQEPDRWVVIDAGRPMQDVQAEIQSVVAERLA